MNSSIKSGINNKEQFLVHKAVEIEMMELIKVIKYRDVDYEIAKKEVAGYFQMKGQAS